MSPFHEDAKLRAEQYANRTNQSLEDLLGWGWDGIVFGTSGGTAVKSLLYENLYLRELEAYIRLRDAEISQICGFAVPRLVGHDDTLWVVEMGVVSPPCVLDFAQSYDELHPSYPEFPDYGQAPQDALGDRWDTVRDILSKLRSIGIHCQ